MADMAKAIESLEKFLGDKVVDQFEVGTAIRWVAAGRYNYMAFKTPIGWFTTAGTGNRYVDSFVSFEGLGKILKRSEVTNIEVALNWVPLGDQVPVEPRAERPLAKVNHRLNPMSSGTRYSEPMFSDEGGDEGYDYPGLGGESV